MLNKLKEYQNWRTGKDKRSLHETDLTPAVVGQCIEWAIKEIERLQALERNQ